jgi:hypothetical protein
MNEFHDLGNGCFLLIQGLITETPALAALSNPPVPVGHRQSCSAARAQRRLLSIA